MGMTASRWVRVVMTTENHDLETQTEARMCVFGMYMFYGHPHLYFAL